MLETLLTGVLGGAGTIFIWEVLIKPSRERRNVAEMLSAEVSINMQMLAAARVTAHRVTIGHRALLARPPE